MKRKAPSGDQANANNNNDSSLDASKDDKIGWLSLTAHSCPCPIWATQSYKFRFSPDSPVKTKRARKAPSKLADYAVGGEIRDASPATTAAPVAGKSRDASIFAPIKSRDASAFASS